MDNKFYITTPLYYVNALPHIGHSYTNIAADSLTRYMRKCIGKENVWLLTGTDEYGQKIQRAADEAGIEINNFADKMAKRFKDLWQQLNISYNDFIRTTETRHIIIVQRVLEILYAKGDIYEAKYKGWYCTPCETFWTQMQIQDQLCPDCKRPLENIAEKNFFFKLSSYQDWLIEYIKGHTDFIRPLSRRQEVLSFLESNYLTDLCISRPKERLSWGIPVPFSSGHVVYVWFDALINYISAVGEFDSNGDYKSRWWPADLHLIGKDILRQHAIYWPIILRALNIEPPHTIFAHGWWLIGEDKMSKSRGNVVSPSEILAKYSLDIYRYFLLRDMPFGLDGTFSEGAMVKRFNSDLANDLGNLLYRTLTMVEKYFAGVVPSAVSGWEDKEAKAIRVKLTGLEEKISAVLAVDMDYNFSLALGNIWEAVNMANKYIEDTKPWNLVKENKLEQLKGFINLLVQVIRKVADTISPFMPQTSDSILEQLGTDRIKKGSPLFPRIDTRQR